VASHEAARIATQGGAPPARRLLFVAGMKILRLLMMVGGGVYLYRRFFGGQTLQAGGMDAPADTSVAPSAGSMRDVATRSGIADVDPQPLSQMVEAIDPDATEAAHTELRDLHDRLPR
jgi:hypothetical protein